MQISHEMLARIIATVGLLFLGLWIIHWFIVPLAWAVVLAIATYPYYQKLQARIPQSYRVTWAPIAMTVIVTVVILIPISYGLVKAVYEIESLTRLMSKAQQEGLPTPDWLTHLPLIGAWATAKFADLFGTADSANETLLGLGGSAGREWARAIAGQVFGRFIALLIILLALFFLYRDGEWLGERVLRLATRLFGQTGNRYAMHAMESVQAIVDGLVLVGMGFGIVMGFAYYAVGLPQPAMLGLATGVLAMIPFAAPLVFGSAAVVLYAQGSVAAAIGIASFGGIVLFVADHFIRPGLIGSSAKVPFLWVLVGLLGGVETMGLLGLFLGPTVIAVLTTVWRDAVGDAVSGALDDVNAQGEAPSATGP